MFILGKLLGALLLPPGLFIAIAVIAVVLRMASKRKAAFGIMILDIVLIYLLSTTAFSSLIIAPLENEFPPISDQQDYQIIVVLGGGYNDRSPEYGGIPALSPVSEKRAVYGVELARLFNLPLAYSGGKSYSVKTGGTEADAAERLWLSLGIPKNRMVLENASLDTKMNASGVAALIKEKRAILVTSAFHMPRAMLSFQKAKISVVAAPTDYLAKRSPLTWADYLPNVFALETSFVALHEYIGLLYYRLIFYRTDNKK